MFYTSLQMVSRNFSYFRVSKLKLDFVLGCINFPTVFALKKISQYMWRDFSHMLVRFS